jgi:SAM-dependent methyltransferase
MSSLDSRRHAGVAANANAARWSADDDAWRGYKRVGDRLVLEDRVARTLALAIPRPGGAYLDVGCGPGVLTKLFADRIGAARVAGVDQLDRGSGLEFRAFNLDERAALPFEDASFDVVSCLETLEHVHDTDHLVGEIRRVLKPNGYALMSVPRLDGLLSILMLTAGVQPPAVECSLRRRYGAPGEPDRVSGHVSHFTRRALSSLLHANGFEVDASAQASIYSGWLFAQERPSPWVRIPLWLLSRLPFKQDDLIVRVRPRL